MKKLAKAKKVSINQAWIKLHKLELNFDIKELWITDINMVLNKDNNAPVDYLNEELINVCENVLQENPILFEEADWKVKSFNKYSLATFMADTMFAAFETLSSKWIPAFKVFFDEAKDVLRRYERENWPIIEKVANLEPVEEIEESDSQKILAIVTVIKDMIEKAPVRKVEYSDSWAGQIEEPIYVQDDVPAIKEWETNPINIWWIVFNPTPVPQWKKKK